MKTRFLFLFLCLAAVAFADALLQQAHDALANRRYDIATTLLDRILASNTTSNVVADAQEMRAKAYQDWRLWLRQSQKSLEAMSASNTAAVAAAKEELRKAQAAFSGSVQKDAAARTGRMTGGSTGMKAVAGVGKQLSDLELKQQNLDSQLTGTTRLLTQVEDRMIEMHVRLQPPPPPLPAEQGSPTQFSALLKKYWLFAALGLLALLWLVSRRL